MIRLEFRGFGGGADVFMGWCAM